MCLSVLSLSLVNNRTRPRDLQVRTKALCLVALVSILSNDNRLLPRTEFSCSSLPASFSRPDHRDRSLSSVACTSTKFVFDSIEFARSEFFLLLFISILELRKRFPRFRKPNSNFVLVISKAAVFHPTKIYKDV